METDYVYNKVLDGTKEVKNILVVYDCLIFELLKIKSTLEMGGKYTRAELDLIAQEIILNAIRKDKIEQNIKEREMNEDMGDIERR